MSDWSRSLVECLDALAVAESANGWIEKTPVHLHFVDLIEKHIPDAQFVHIVRNGKDACASLYEAASRYPDAWGGRRSARECAERWVSDVAISMRKERHQRHKIVTYEMLVADPKNIIADILESMGIQQHAKSQSILNNWSTFDRAVLPDEPWKKFKSGVAASAGKFDSIFSKEEQAVVTSIVSQVSLP